MPIDIILTDEEAAELLRQDPDTEKEGGFQGLFVKLQRQLDQATNELHLDDDDLERIPRYALRYGRGGWENLFIRIFGDHLGPELRR